MEFYVNFTNSTIRLNLESYSFCFKSLNTNKNLYTCLFFLLPFPMMNYGFNYVTDKYSLAQRCILPVFHFGGFTTMQWQ